jgi:hypothetical protein
MPRCTSGRVYKKKPRITAAPPTEDQDQTPGPRLFKTIDILKFLGCQAEGAQF